MQEGQILVGKYRVDRVLGVGGTGAVFAAHHLQLDTRVAIKFLRPSLLTNQEAVASFVREARAALQMHNEHVARVFDVGTLVTGAPYMVMEFLDGADLGNLLQKRGPLSVDEAVDFVLQACEGLAEAHALGIVHRDLKPTNLFCIRRPDGRPVIKVLDFGISEVTGLGLPPRDQTPTHATAMMGSPLYMSPEQIEASELVDARTDIWALGVILFELLSNRTPFSGDTLPEVSTRISGRPPLPIRDLTPHVPEGLAAVIDTCLEKDRRKRYGDVAALAMALLPFGPKRARVSVERITDLLQATELSVPEVLTQQGADSVNQPASPAVAPALALPALYMPPVPARRPVFGLLAIAGVLGLTGVVVGATTVAFFSKKGIVRLDDIAAAAAASATTSGGASPPGASLAGPVARSNPAAGSAVARPVVAPSSVGSRVAVAAPGDTGLDGRRARSSRSMPAFVRVGWPTSTSTSTSMNGSSSRGAVVSPGGAPAGSAGGEADCNPSFELDDQGRKHFKPECMVGRPLSVSATAHAAPNCDPSFDLDEQGRKHFKPECFANPKR